jgi:hypothetical protein
MSNGDKGLILKMIDELWESESGFNLTDDSFRVNIFIYNSCKNLVENLHSISFHDAWHIIVTDADTRTRTMDLNTDGSFSLPKNAFIFSRQEFFKEKAFIGLAKFFYVQLQRC